MEYRFYAALHTEGNRPFFRIPINLWEKTGLKGNIPCRVAVGGETFECKLIPKGGGAYWIPVTKKRMQGMAPRKEYEILLEPIASLTRINHNSPYSRENPIRKIDGIVPVPAVQGMCGHSCIAMLAGVPLAEVTALMGNRKASWSKLLEALDYYGISYAPKAVYPKGKPTQLPRCCIVYQEDQFLLWFDGAFRGTEKTDGKKIVSYREIRI